MPRPFKIADQYLSIAEEGKVRALIVQEFGSYGRSSVEKVTDQDISAWLKDCIEFVLETSLYPEVE